MQRKERFIGWLKNRYERKQGFIIKDKKVLESAQVFWDRKKVFSLIPQSRAGASLVAVNGRLWLYGGKGVANFDDIYSYSPCMGEWTKIIPADTSERPPEKRLGHVAWTYKNAIYVFGGYSLWMEKLKSSQQFSYGGFTTYSDKVTGRQ
jgi:hypothetical protein